MDCGIRITPELVPWFGERVGTSPRITLRLVGTPYRALPKLQKHSGRWCMYRFASAFLICCSTTVIGSTVYIVLAILTKATCPPHTSEARH
jgi:hypothetical protein